MDALIATGGMAEVWTADDEVLARRVAVKILLPGSARDPVLVERFRREALAAARLEHPNIISIYDTGTDASGEEARHFIVMEFCPGGSLRSRLAASGPMEHERVVGTGITICDALAHAHLQGVIHRDVKPANVLITDHGTLKVSDFGIAKAAFAALDITASGSTVGTATYIAPELASGGQADPRSDLYSLGVLLYELLVGRPPFQEASEVATAISHVRRPPPAPRTLRAGIPRSVEDVVMRALAKDPDARFGSAEEMKRALASLSGGDATRAFVPLGAPDGRATSHPADEPTGSTREFLRSEGRRIGGLVALVVLAVVVALLVGSLVRNQDPDSPPGSSGDGAAAAEPLRIASATDFDPHADGVEHADEVELAVDEDPSTFWRTEDYDDPISLQKPGVGLLFDLGDSVRVTEVELVLDREGYVLELRAGDSVATDEQGFELIEDVDSSDATQAFETDVEARYWLIWLKDLPGGTGRGAIAEVIFRGA